MDRFRGSHSWIHWAICAVLVALPLASVNTKSPASTTRASQTYLFFSNYDGTNIGRADIDGTHVKQNFITGVYDPIGLASYGDYLYWSNPGPDGSPGTTIGRASLKGTGVETAIPPYPGSPTPAP